MEFQFKTLLTEIIDSQILLVTFNRPTVANAINIDMMHDLLNLWRALSVDTQKIRCVILTGAGRTFCAGADLKARKDMSLATWREQHAVLQLAMQAMINCQIPIIAAVNGAAFGGGLELLLASDFAYAANTATFAQSEVKIGIIPGAMGTQHLPRACGLRRAKELCFTASSFSAAEADHWGIVNKLCEPDALMPTVLATARTICSNAPLAIRQAKKALNVSQHLSIESGYAVEVAAYHQVLLTKDRAEGIQAFNEKRKPSFQAE